MVEREEVDIKQHQKHPGETRTVARDLINGMLAGAIGIYLTQPFDTVRVRILVLTFNNYRSECKLTDSYIPQFLVPSLRLLRLKA